MAGFIDVLLRVRGGSEYRLPDLPSWFGNYRRDQAARMSPKIRSMMGLLAVFSGALLLASAWDACGNERAFTP